MGRLPLLALLFAASPALAQSGATPADPPTITVAGTGKVSTPPDRATISFDVRGEGADATAAATALAARQKALARGLAGLGSQRIDTGSVTLGEVRGKECEAQSYRPQLSTGTCAIAGSIATLQGTLVLADATKAGNAVALLGQLGAANARLNGFGLADSTDAQRRAKAAAVADAQATAAAIAQATGGRLGRIIAVRDMAAGYGPDIVVTARMAVPPPPPPPPPMAAPVQLDVNPRPIETEARLTITYAIDR